MKITHIITTLVYGGAEKLLANFSAIQIEMHDIEIIYLKGSPLISKLLDKRIKVTHIPLNLNVFKMVKEHLKLTKPDILHTHLGHADLIGLWASRGLPIKKICTMHNIWFKWDYRDRIIFFVYWLIFRTVARDCTVISISKSVKEHVDNCLKVRSKNSILLHNAIPNLSSIYNKKEARALLKIPMNVYCILFIGRLAKQKSVETLISSIKILSQEWKDVKLIILGVGELKQELIDIVNESNLENVVEFRGNSPSPERYLEAADLFVLPSIFEGLGLVILEAFRSQVPVIATNIEGPKELIENGVNGLLFEPLDINGLICQIKKVRNNPGFAQELATNGKTTFLNKYVIQDYANTLNKLYNE